MQLLNTNSKLLKATSKTLAYMVRGLTIAPHTMGGGKTVCSDATAGCIEACNMVFSGMQIYPSTRKAMINRKKFLQTDPQEFERTLRHDIELHWKQAKKKGLKPALRLNTASDLDWRRLIGDYPDILCYDYTKVKSRIRDQIAGRNPDNYFLTYSQNERSHPRTVSSFLDAGVNVAAVYAVDYFPAVKKFGKLPKTATIWRKVYKVLNGDKHDYRLPIFDGYGNIIGLALKGINASKERARKSGFAIHV